VVRLFVLFQTGLCSPAEYFVDNLSRFLRVQVGWPSCCQVRQRTKESFAHAWSITIDYQHSQLVVFVPHNSNAYFSCEASNVYTNSIGIR